MSVLKIKMSSGLSLPLPAVPREQILVPILIAMGVVVVVVVVHRLRTTVIDHGDAHAHEEEAVDYLMVRQ